MQGRVGAWETDFWPDNGSGTKIALGQRGVPPEIQAGDLFVLRDTQNSPLVGGQHKTGLGQRELRVGGRQTPEELSVDKKEMLRPLELKKQQGGGGWLPVGRGFQIQWWFGRQIGRGGG